MDAPGAAERLGVRLHRVYALVRENRIPSVRIGRQVRIDPAALEEWIASGGSGLDDE
ncbi:MAG: helix-turn-helix domain-containing protein [Gemmatimonadota bacterium]